MASNLSSAQFQGFHGTTADIPKSLRPAAEHQKGSVWEDTGEPYGQPARQHAYATMDEDTAWRFADMTQNQWGGRPRVYTVEQHASKVRPGVYNSEHPKYNDWDEDWPGQPEDLQEYVAPRFKVTGRLDIKPDHQGTFPEIDWNKHKNPDAPYWYDANHPAPWENESYGDMTRSNREVRFNKVGKNHGWGAAADWSREEADATNPFIGNKLKADLPAPQVKGQMSIRGWGGEPKAENPLMPQPVEAYRARRRRR
jgi:hypothetical protein